MSAFSFESILIFAFLSCLLIVGVILRGTITYIQYFLIPSSIIGGILGLSILHITKYYNLIDYQNVVSILETFAYHFFNISFISIGLTPSQKDKSYLTIYKGSLWMAFIQGINFPLQAVVGGMVVFILISLGIEIHPMVGFLFPLGFNEGPGQALSFGKVWEGFGFDHAASIGLTFATLGYLFCIFIGVPLANWGIKKGWIKNIKKPTEDFIRGYYSSNRTELIKIQNTIHPNSLEPLAFQVSLVGLVILITYIFLWILSQFLPDDVSRMLWGFFFLFGIAFSILVQKLLQAIKKDYLIEPFIQEKITSFAVDFLVVSTIASIQIHIFKTYLIPIVLISLIGGILTTLLIVLFGRKLKNYFWERILAIFGTVTGTTSTGLLLLKIVDAKLETPVAKELALMNLFSIPIIGIYTIIINGYFWWKLSLLTMIFIYLGFGIIFFTITYLFQNKYKA
jgi:ESS family glutamate:Na+ symporter